MAMHTSTISGQARALATSSAASYATRSEVPDILAAVDAVS